jgi:sugar phosphate isomerase/epimerase
LASFRLFFYPFNANRKIIKLREDPYPYAMTIYHRRNFIKQTAVAIAALGMAHPLAALARKNYKLSFSTLGCPKWSFKEIVAFAAKHHYQGIEIRGIQGELDLTKCPAFSKGNIQGSIQLLKDNGLQIVGLGSSAKMHVKEETLRKKNLDEAKQFIDLAGTLNCEAVRVFPDKLPAEVGRQESMDLISAGLTALGNYAEGTKVKVWLESHGDLVYADDLLAVMNNVDKRNVALIWDVFNMWIKTKESPADVYAKLQPHIQHVHLKDGVLGNGKITYVLFGKGEAPNREALSVLQQAAYSGFYSFEWEKMWHPEIEEPEVAFAHFAKAVKGYL